MTPDSIGKDNAISFLNRDHIISVVVHRGEIVVTTTAGDKITVPVSQATLEKFVDDLANHVESNFVAIAAHANAAATTQAQRPTLR
jgi:microsomal dipeptidase-like Zn-dependent dipeptidase